MTNYEKYYWDTRYKMGGNSGDGSYGYKVARKLDWIKDKVKDINSIAELGCGDFNFGRQLTQLYPDATYHGIDVSGEIIKRNSELYPNYTFVEEGELPKADLVLCVDVLLHVIEDSEVENILKKLENSWTKYLVISAYERDEDMNNHVRIRKFDYKRFGEPILREICEEEGSMYFYIFEK